MKMKIDLPMLDQIIKDTVKHLEEGKKQIADFADTAHAELNDLKARLKKVQNDTQFIIKQVDQTEKAEKEARLRLMEVSRDFEKYSEEDIKDAYNKAREIQIQLGNLRGQEAQMRVMRDQMEISVRRMKFYVQRAENLVSTVGIVLNFLVSNLQGVGLKLEEMQQRQFLGLRVIKAQEEERKRVAREIHDGPAQSMANLVLRAEICEKLMDKQPEVLREELHSLKEMVKDSLQEVRRIIFELRPMVLDDLGLVPALKRYITVFEEKNNITVELKATGTNQVRLHSSLEIALFRIVQEALTNVSKHAQAGSVSVNLEQVQNRINLRIKDDGRGFSLQQVMNGNKGESFGLLGMRERVELLEGEFKITTGPQEGTDIFIKIPIKDSDEKVTPK